MLVAIVAFTPLHTPPLSLVTFSTAGSATMPSGKESASDSTPVVAGVASTAAGTALIALAVLLKRQPHSKLKVTHRPRSFLFTTTMTTTSSKAVVSYWTAFAPLHQRCLSQAPGAASHPLAGKLRRFTDNRRRRMMDASVGNRYQHHLPGRWSRAQDMPRMLSRTNPVPVGTAHRCVDSHRRRLERLGVTTPPIRSCHYRRSLTRRGRAYAMPRMPPKMAVSGTPVRMRQTVRRNG